MVHDVYWGKDRAGVLYNCCSILIEKKSKSMSKPCVVVTSDVLWTPVPGTCLVIGNRAQFTGRERTHHKIDSGFSLVSELPKTRKPGT